MDEMKQSECEEILRRAVQDHQNVKLVDFKICPFKSTLGFMGDHFILSLTYVHGGSGKNNKCTFFVKQVPTNECHSNYVLGEGLFAKEKEIYENIVPMFCKFLKVQKIPVPEYYFIKDNKFMVFENLTEKGFKMHDKLVPLDFIHCKRVLKTLALFHAGSIITEYKTGKKIVEFVKYDHEVILVNNKSKSIARSWNVTSMENIFRMMQKSGKYDERVGGDWKFVHKKFSEAWERYIEMAAEPSSKFRNIICHRDLWLNNILFKYDASGKPEEVALVDFQIYRYCPPALDLTMFMYVTTTREFREQHLLSLLLTYHSELCMALQAAGLDPEGPHGLGLPEILASFEEYRFFGLLVATRYLPSCLRNENDMESMREEMVALPNQNLEQNTLTEEFLNQSAEILIRGMQQCKALNKRMTNIVSELLDWTLN